MENAQEGYDKNPGKTGSNEDRYAVVGPDGTVLGYKETEKEAKKASRQAAKENRG